MAITPTTAHPEASTPRSIRQSGHLRSSPCVSGQYRRLAAPVVAAGILGTASIAAPAQTWRVEPAIDATVTLTDNVGLAPPGLERGDLIFQVTPSLRINEKGAHTSLTGFVGATVLQYARDGGTSVDPAVSLRGTAELYERLFYVDAAIEVGQASFSPFSAQPRNLANKTDNRYTAQAYRVSPYLKHDLPGGVHYEVRDDNIWTNASGAPVATDRSYANDLFAFVTRDPVPLGWSLDYTRNDTRFGSESSLVSELERAHGLWQASAQWQLSTTVGYENNRYPLATYTGEIYGLGAKWRPGERTTVDAAWEHRFFGGSYHVAFDHRTPLSVWSLRAARDITTTPQQFALGASNDVATLLNQLFTTRITDPLQRQTFVDQFIRERGLPSVLTSPLRLYTQQITLQESVFGTVGILGARNTVFVTVYRSRNEPVQGSAVVVGLTDIANNTQSGTNAVWTFKLTPLYTLTTNADWVRTTGNGDVDRRSSQFTISSIVEAPLSPLTTLFGGLRYQRFISDVENEYRETAGFVGVSHRFR